MSLTNQFVLAALCLAAIGRPAAQNSQHDCALSDENRQEQSVKLNGFNFTWSSNWSEDPYRYCICREVHNLSPKNLYYSWPVVGTFENKALPPDKIDSVCSRDEDYAKPPVEADLYYGRQGYVTRTLVWLSVNDSKISSKAKPQTDRAFLRLGGDFGLESGTSSDIPPIGPVLHTVYTTMDLYTKSLFVKKYILFIPHSRRKTVNARLDIRSRVEETPSGYRIINSIANILPNNSTCISVVVDDSFGQTHLLTRGRQQMRPKALHNFLDHVWSTQVAPSPEVCHLGDEVGVEETKEPPVLKPSVITLGAGLEQGVIKFVIPLWVKDQSENRQ